MSDAILIQHAHPDTNPDFEAMLQLTHARHADYCQGHQLDFWSRVYNDPAYPAISGAWLKIQLILEAMELGYESIIWLDADTLIWDMRADLRAGIPEGGVGACWHRIPQLNHWNVGALYIENTAGTQSFMREWFAAYPAPPDGWNEQGVFNRMALQSRIVSTISDKWNATIGVNMVPDAAVLGYHGQGPGARRLSLMHQTLQREQIGV